MTVPPTMLRAVPLALALLGLLLMPACKETQDDDDATPADDDAAGDDDTGDDDDVAGAPQVSLIDAVVSEVIPTVVTVTWTVDGGELDGTYAEFGPDDDYGHRAPGIPVGEDGTYEAFLLGNKPLSTVHFRVVAENGVGGDATDDDSRVLGAAPAELPGTAVTVEDADRAVAGYLVTTVLTNPSWAVIQDTDGEFVWWHQPDGEWDQILISRALLSVDGRSLLYVAASTAVGEGGERVLVRVRLDGTEVETLSVPGAHHDFVELPDGTVATIQNDSRTVEDQLVTGDRILEIDGGGNTSTIWTVWDHAEYDPEFEPGVGNEWTHANALDYDPAEDAYYLSIRSFDTIWKIDRASGDVLWKLGGELSDFEMAGGDTEFFEWQHQFQILEDGIVVFDNRAPPGLTSRVVEYALDWPNYTGEEIGYYVTTPTLYCVGYGDVTRLDSGDTLVTWSSNGMVDHATPEGDLVWRLNLDLGGALGFASFHEDLYP